MKKIKLSEWAQLNAVTYHTAYRLFRQGKLPQKATQLQTGTILVEVEPVEHSGAAPRDPLKAVTYSRVSSYLKKEDLDRQAQRVADFCAANGWTVHKEVKEVASGLNDQRPKLRQLIESLAQGPAKTLVVEHKDRLTRFGFNYFEVLFPLIGVNLVVINRDQEDEADLLKDFSAIITSFCCRLYGLRRSTRKAVEVKKLLELPDAEPEEPPVSESL